MSSHQYIEFQGRNQQCFAQQKPHFICQCRGAMHKASVKAGYPLPCRRMRCSKACNGNWARKQAAILDYFLHEMVAPTCHLFRGNLTMPKGATPADHTAARGSFLRAIGRRCPELHIRCVMHITSLHEAHYDLVGYGPGAIDPADAERAIKESWQVAGGRRATCKPLDSQDELDDEARAIAMYVVKARPRDDKFRFVPLQLKNGGIKVTFGTGRFFGVGVKEAAVWKARNEALYPRRFKAMFSADWSDRLESDDRDDVAATMGAAGSDPSHPPITIGNNTSSPDPHQPPSDPPSAESDWAALAGRSHVLEFTTGSLAEIRLAAFQAAHPDRVEIHAVKTPLAPPDQDKLLVADLHAVLPTTPAEAVTATELGERTGWQPSQVERALSLVPGVVQTHRLDLDGTWRDEALYRPERRPDPPAHRPEQPDRTDDPGILLPAERAEMEAMFGDLIDP